MALLAIGLFMVMDATAPKNSLNHVSSLLAIKQFTWDLLALFFFFTFIIYIPISWVKKMAPAMAVFTLFLLTFVLVFGTEINGAKRWFRFGLIGFQPSEMSKVTCILFFAWYLDKRKEEISKWYGMFPCMLMILLPVGLIALEPDLGNAALLFCVLVSMLYIAGARLIHLFWWILMTMPAFCFFMYSKFDHIKKRLMVYLEPGEHLRDGFYQGHQALIALGSGGLTGKGIGVGLQKLYYLPEAHNDFIFAIIGEDLGLLGCWMVLLLYGIFVWYAIQVCKRTTDLYSLLLVYGITFIFAGQALFNMSVVTAVVPNKGISLPLISYGGSNVLFTLVGLSILIKLTKELPPDRAIELGAIRLKKKKKALF